MPVALNKIDASIVKGMLARGDKQQDIAAFFGCNPARVNDIKKNRRFPEVEAAPDHILPPSGTLRPTPDTTVAEAVREVLVDFSKQLVRELATAAHERRQTNEKLDLLMRQQAELRRDLGALERPLSPRPTRRKPMGE